MDPTTAVDHHFLERDLFGSCRSTGRGAFRLEPCRLLDLHDNSLENGRGFHQGFRGREGISALATGESRGEETDRSRDAEGTSGDHDGVDLWVA
jgi:hypothetical protein